MSPISFFSLLAFVCVLGGAQAHQALQAASASAWPYQISRTDDLPSRAVKFFRVVDAGATADLTVSQKEKSFSPAEASVRVGQTLSIVNDDTTVHNAYCQSGDFKYNSGPQQPGGSSKLVFTSAGTYEVRCAIHPKMKLVVTVTD